MRLDYRPAVRTYGVNEFTVGFGVSEPGDAVYDAGLFYGGVAVCVGAVAVPPPRAFGYAVARGVVAGAGMPARIGFAAGNSQIESPGHYECFNLFGCLRCAYRGF